MQERSRHGPLDPGDARAPLRVLVLDKAPDYRHRLLSVLTGQPDVEVLLGTRDLDAAVAHARHRPPHVVIVDPAGLAEPGRAIADLRAAAPEARVLLHSALPQAVLTPLLPSADAALEKGADGGTLLRLLRGLR